jgi:hypothetical protein
LGSSTIIDRSWFPYGKGIRQELAGFSLRLN